MGPLVCFIHHASDGVSYPKLFHKQRPCRIWSVSAVLSLPAGKKQISHSGNSGERERKRPLQEQGFCSLSLMGEILRNYGQMAKLALLLHLMFRKILIHRSVVIQAFVCLQSVMGSFCFSLAPEPTVECGRRTPSGRPAWGGSVQTRLTKSPAA